MKFIAFIVTVALALPAFATQITNVGDPIIGGQFAGDYNNPTAGTFDEGTVGFDQPGNNWPGGEAPENIINDTTLKYLNFGKEGTGILVSPAGGQSVLNRIQSWTANDSPERDPMSYVIWGSNDPAMHASNYVGGAQDSVSLSSISFVNGGPMDMPMSGAGQSRNGDNDPIADALYWTNTTFENTDAYCTYVVVFPTIRDAVAANSMQIAELQLHGDFTNEPCAVPEPSSAAFLLGLLVLVPVLRRRK